MAAETNLEREYKFDVDPDFDPPDLRPVVGRTERLPEQHLTTTYFDTADHRLWAHGITLRHRVETEGDAAPGDPGKWTLKLPDAGNGGRHDLARFEHTWKGGLGDVPQEATAIMAGLVRRAPLEPVVVLATERRRLLLHGTGAGDSGSDSDSDGGREELAAGPWAEMDDDLVTVASGQRQGLRFRQLELELLTGATASLDEHVGNGAGHASTNGGGPAGLPAGRVLDELRRAGAVPGGGSKFAVAAGLDEYGAARNDASTPGDGKSPTLASVIGAILRTDLGHLLDWDYRLRVPAPSGDRADLDVEAVHQARVATRRLRSDLKTFQSVLDPVWLKHVEADLKWVGGLLGRLRDEDVLGERIRAHTEAEDTEAVAELIVLLRRDRHLGATELCEALTSERYTALIERINAGAQSPPLVGALGEAPDGPLDETLRSVVSARLRTARSGIDDLGPKPASEDLHHVRILSKRLRYAAEAVEPYLGKGAARTAKAAKALQSCLGILNDAVNASHALRELACHPSVTPTVAFVAGRIAGQAEAEAEDVRRTWRKLAKKLESGKTASWLR